MPTDAVNYGVYVLARTPLYKASTPLMQQVQEMLAREPGREFTASEIAEALNIPRQRLAGAVGAYSGLVYRRFGRYSWPFDVRRDHAARQTYYLMPAAVAHHVLAAAAAGGCST